MTQQVPTGLIADGSVTTSKLADGAITALKITDATITQAKLAATIAGTGPAFSAYLSGAQTIPATTWTKITCQTKEFDTHTAYNTSTYRFTPTVAGYYYVTVTVSGNTAQTQLGVGVYKNGAASKYFQLIAAPANGMVTGTALVSMNGTTDYLEAMVYSASGVDLTTASTTTFFQAHMVRAA